MKIRSSKLYTLLFNLSVQFMLLVAIPLAAVSQNLNFRHYTTTDGLAGMSTFMSMQDSKGYIWFATTEGVSRFDGTNFTTYNNSDGLADNSVLRIYEDHLERIWFLTYNGHLCYFSLRDNQIHNEITDPFLKKLYTGSGYDNMLIDSKKRIWFCSINLSVTVLDGENVFQPMVPKIVSSFILRAFEDDTNQIYFITDKYKFTYSEKDSTISLIDTNHVKQAIRFFGTTPEINCFATSEDICIINKGQIQKLVPLKLLGLQPDGILTINYIKNTVLAATRGQGLVMVENCGSNPKVARYPIARSITSATIDLEDNIWLSTQTDGIYKLSSQYRKGRYLSLEAFKGENILSICRIKENAFLIGTYNGSLYLWKTDRLTELHIYDESTPSPGMIRNIQTDSKGNVWIFGETGLLYGNIEKILANDESKTNFRLLNVLKFNNLSEGADNNLVFVTAQGIYYIQYDKQKISIIPDSLVHKSYRRLYNICQSKNGITYYSSIDGLFRYQNGKINQVQIENKLLNTRIKYIDETKDTVLLISTVGNGVFFMKNNIVINHLTSEDGLASDICGKLIIKGDTILVCTNKGLSYFNYRNNKCSNIQTYNGNNGLLQGEVLDAEKDGENIYVITSAGFSIVPFTMQALVTEEPNFYITGIYNYKDEILNSPIITVPDKNNILKVKYTAITFNRNDEVQYQYKFDNGNWNTTHLTELIFPDLSPGNHTLLLKARKAGSNWSKVETIHIYAEYPFYLSWWFLTSVTLLASAAFVTFIIYLNRRRNRQLMLMMEKRSALNHERNRISADMHDDVGSDLSKISITSEFAKAQLHKGDEMYKQLEKITGFAYGARKKMDDIIWALNPENDTLGNLIAYVNTFGLNYFGDTEIRFQIKNEITEDLGLVLNSKERRNLYLIVKELCTNVFKHSGAKNFTITFKSTSDNIIIETNDDGKGFEPAVKTSSGYGLQNISRRINEIQGTMIHLKSDGGRGTTYQFQFPKS